MAQTITSVAVLGTRYLSGVQYRVLNTAGTFYPGPADNLANGTHLGNGVWRATVTLPDAGGEVRWSQSASILAVDVVEVASGLTNAQEIKLNELYRKAGLDPAAPVTRTLNPSTGNVAETFTGVAINHVEAGTTVVTTRQT